VLALLSLDPEALLKSFGLLGLMAVVFAESGLLVGFFLPGDSLLFTAGLLSSQHLLPVLPVLLAGSFTAAVAGDQVGYLFGRKVGPSLFRRPESRLFRHENVERAQAFFERHGSRTIVLARFVPVVRTFAPIVAGVSRMHYRTFVAFNVVGGLLWAVGITTLGYFLGATVPSIDRYLLPIVALIMVVSLVPVLYEVRKSRRARISADG
jgi:membrane-associated protein